MSQPTLITEEYNFAISAKLSELLAHSESESAAVIAEQAREVPAAELWERLQAASPQIRANIFSYLEKDVQVDIAEMLSRGELAQLLSYMSPDDRVDLLKDLPEERAEAILPALAQAQREDIRKLSSYPEGSAGAAMTSDYAVLTPELSAEQALVKLRREAPNKETIYYAYVIDSDRKLLGSVSLKDLILARPHVKIEDIMQREIVFARALEDQEEAARKIQKYDLIALPVINGGDALVGIITHDDALDIVTQEHTEDLEKFMAIAGAHEAEMYRRTGAWTHFKNRVGWVMGLAVLGLVSGSIIHSFEATIASLMILALYMPMIADSGGNTGSQAATVVVRALALKEISTRDILHVLWKELRVGLGLAVVLGVLSWGKVMFLSYGTELDLPVSLHTIGLVIALALAIQVTTATLIGAMLPMAASKLKLDPAVVASPALTTLVDISGLLIYFTTAKTLLGV